MLVSVRDKIQRLHFMILGTEFSWAYPKTGIKVKPPAILHPSSYLVSLGEVSQSPCYLESPQGA